MPPDADLDDLPLFPLSRPLLPDGLLGLQVFELRYLEMIGRCLREGTPFGVVGLVAGQEVQRPAGDQPSGYAEEAFHEVGTMAVIESHSRPRAGLILLRARGGRRFRVLSSERTRSGLWMAQARELPPVPPMALPADLASLGERLRQLLLHFERRSPDPEARPVGEPYRLVDCGWVANRWAELLPLSPPVLQSLLTTDSPLLRLELVSDLLDEVQAGRKP